MLVHHVGSFWKPSLCNKQAKIILGETAAHIVQFYHKNLYYDKIRLLMISLTALQIVQLFTVKSFCSKNQTAAC